MVLRTRASACPEGRPGGPRTRGFPAFLPRGAAARGDHLHRLRAGRARVPGVHGARVDHHPCRRAHARPAALLGRRGRAPAGAGQPGAHRGGTDVVLSLLRGERVPRSRPRGRAAHPEEARGAARRARPPRAATSAGGRRARRRLAAPLRRQARARPPAARAARLQRSAPLRAAGPRLGRRRPRSPRDQGAPRQGRPPAAHQLRGAVKRLQWSEPTTDSLSAQRRARSSLG